MEIPLGNTMENSGKQNPKGGFKSPRAEMLFYKLFILKHLCSKKLGQIQNLVPHRLMSRLNPRPLQAGQMLKIQDFAVEHNCRVVLSTHEPSVLFLDEPTAGLIRFIDKVSGVFFINKTPGLHNLFNYSLYG